MIDKGYLWVVYCPDQCSYLVRNNLTNKITCVIESEHKYIVGGCSSFDNGGLMPCAVILTSSSEPPKQVLPVTIVPIPNIDVGIKVLDTRDYSFTVVEVDNNESLSFLGISQPQYTIDYVESKPKIL